MFPITFSFKLKTWRQKMSRESKELQVFWLAELDVFGSDVFLYFVTLINSFS